LQSLSLSPPRSKMQQSKTIIVVEDDPDSLFLIRKVLENAGYAVECFQDGSHLLDGDHYQTPSLFILDNNIGMVDGITVCKYLKGRQERRSIPIVMMSGSLEFETIALQSGVDYFFSKPLNMTKLLKVVGSLLADSIEEVK
jgi:two-component system, OmpR family, phosphate regulon response regulator PhoB